MTRIPIYLIETEIDPGLPTERTYRHKAEGKHVGSIIVPDGTTTTQEHDFINFHLPDKQYRCMLTVETVRAAIAGEYGLAWEPEP